RRGGCDLGHVQKLLPKQTNRGFVRRDCDCVAGSAKHHDANVRVARSRFCRYAISEERLRAISRAV
ncbi:chromate transporter, chromate ion transporter family protein, partial [Vibrio parahaemolyticus V-223/04]